MKPIFSVCIPNFNYESYIEETIESVLKQNIEHIEICIADNASTDNSFEIIKKFAEVDKRVRCVKNPTNVGFAANLDIAGSMAGGNCMIMLSSDDVMCSDALYEYNKLIKLIPEGERFTITSTFEKIDSNGNFIEYISPKKSSIWDKKDIDPFLSKQMGFDVYKMNNEELLKRCLKRFQNPFNFAATCYPSELYRNAGGYGGSRLINPDKWFHWKIMSVSEYAYFLDKPLFKYRWHQNNQTGLQQKSGVLKLWLDDYRNCFEYTPEMLQKTGLSSNDVQHAFCMHISKYILRNIIDKQPEMASRLWHFALAAYPDLMKRTKYALVISFALKTYPLSSFILKTMENLQKKSD
jgi:glycosyltransferase involved in cell wall biosynthesis